MQHNTITLDTLDCLKDTILQTLERLKILPGLVRFIFSDMSLIQTIKKLTPLIEIFSPIFLPDTHKFVQIDDMIEHASNFTKFLQHKKNITSLDQWYFNTRLVSQRFYAQKERKRWFLFKGQLRAPSELDMYFCDRNQLANNVISFHQTLQELELSLCTSQAVYTEAYQEFIQQFGGTIRLKVRSDNIRDFIFI